MSQNRPRQGQPDESGEPAVDRLPVYRRRHVDEPMITLRVIGIAVVIASALLLMTAALLLATRSPRSARGFSTAVVTVIAANTPTFTPNAAVTQPADAGGDLPTPQPGVIAKGAYVQIVGTEGAGLRLRDQAGLAGTVVTLGSEAEVFKVEDGPKELDGYTWWYLVGPFDTSRKGWAVTNYLQVVQNP